MLETQYVLIPLKQPAGNYTIMKIAIGCDHAGYTVKEEIKKFLERRGDSVKDFGTNSGDPVDYPDYVHPLAKAVEKKEFDFGVLVCGSGNGVAMTANKHQGIRAALCWNEEIARLAREHNDANVICIPARFVSPEEAVNMAGKFTLTPFEGGRHGRRVKKISC